MFISPHGCGTSWAIERTGHSLKVANQRATHHHDTPSHSPFSCLQRQIDLNRVTFTNRSFSQRKYSRQERQQSAEFSQNKHPSEAAQSPCNPNIQVGMGIPTCHRDSFSISNSSNTGWHLLCRIICNSSSNNSYSNSSNRTSIRRTISRCVQALIMDLRWLISNSLGSKIR